MRACSSRSERRSNPLHPRLLSWLPDAWLLDWGWALRQSQHRSMAPKWPPAAWRGRFVSAYQLAITIGIFLAYLIDQALAADRSLAVDARHCRDTRNPSGRSDGLAPESARWLIKHGKRETLYGCSIVSTLMRTTMQSLQRSKVAPDEVKSAAGVNVFAPAWRRPLLVASARHISSDHRHQRDHLLCDDIFARAGFATPEAQTTATTWAIGACECAGDVHRHCVH